MVCSLRRAAKPNETPEQLSESFTHGNHTDDDHDTHNLHHEKIRTAYPATHNFC